MELSKQKNSDEYEEEEEYDEDDEEYEDGEEDFYEEEEEDYENNNHTNQTKQDTFLSCEDNLEDLSELAIMLNQTGFLYKFDFNTKTWNSLGKSSIEIIADSVSQKGNFQALIVCTLAENRKSFEFEITRSLNVNEFKNSNQACYWFDYKKLAGNLSNVCGIRFDNQSVMEQFKNEVEKCQSKLEFNSSQTASRSFSSINNIWLPSDILPDESEDKSACRFEKQITFNLNEQFNMPSCVLNITPMDNFFFISIKQNEVILFKHIINNKQTFELRYIKHIYIYLKGKLILI